MGFVSNMVKAIQYNRGLLQRPTLKEKHDKSGSYSDLGKDWKFKKASKKLLEKIRVTSAEQRKKNLFRQVVALLSITCVFGIGFWYLFNVKVEPPKRLTRAIPPKFDFFTSKVYPLENGLELKLEFLRAGPKIAETKYKNGRKHQTTESYYASGEQFRSALYDNDTLVVDYYFFKNGDTIPDFSADYADKVRHFATRNSGGNKIISFDYWDGKIVPETYQEYDLNQAGLD